ncbi:MAG: hypothetical protein CSA55_03340 [Ilumatobacter coccineus]|uniref:MATE family efflux transporter n=1 Tax=Ilumatobacter coccineus TaxID=467094 RepID=A0A2G6K9Q9_9ACTN|nr:MAG: hypothetical protein CSA55_03340 [Ilumatobacter coccineus]
MTTVSKARQLDRRLIRLAIPALGNLAIGPIYVLVDTAIVGRIGTDQLAGLAIAATVLSLVFISGTSLTYGTTEQVAYRLGAGDRPGAATVGVQSAWIALGIGIIEAILLAVFASPIVSVFGGRGEVATHAVTYLTISAVGIPFVMLALSIQGTLRGEADFTSPLAVLAVSNLANLVIELIMVFGLHLGIAGSAWSTVIAQVGAGIWFIAQALPRFGRASHRYPRWVDMVPLLTAGQHLVIRVAAMLVVASGSTAVAARIDKPTLAAFQVVGSLFRFVGLSLDALALPVQTLVAERLGRDDRADAAFVSTRAIRLSIGLGAVMAAITLAASVFSAPLFSNDPGVQSRIAAGMVWLGIALLPAAIAFTYDGVLIGASDYRFLGRAAVGYLGVMIPIAIAILTWPSVGIGGIWAGWLVWLMMRAGVNHVRVQRLLGKGSPSLAQPVS